MRKLDVKNLISQTPEVVNESESSSKKKANYKSDIDPRLIEAFDLFMNLGCEDNKDDETE
ncbi:MAG: hypothetical protein ACOY4Q_00590 [Bacillota bacterium]